MPETQKSAAAPEPLRAYNFHIDIDGYTGYFLRCSELAVRMEPIAYREGGGHTRYLAGPVECAQITLSFGLIASTHEGIWDWFRGAASGKPERKSPSIIFHDLQGIESMRFNLFEALPIGWSTSPLHSLSRDVAVHSLTLAFERFEKAK